MLAAVLFVLGGGVLINTLNSEEPPKTIDAVVDVITDEYKEVAAREGFVSYELND